MSFHIFLERGEAPIVEGKRKKTGGGLSFCVGELRWGIGGGGTLTPGEGR